MKRDNKLLFDILARIEESNGGFVGESQFPDLDPAFVNHHLGLLLRNKFAEGKVGVGDGKTEYVLYELTLKGHNLLDAMRGNQLMADGTESTEDKPQANSKNLKLFISHSSRDKELVNAFVSVLRSALMLEIRQIRCTSVDGLRLPFGANIDAQVRADVLAAEAFVGIISTRSLSSLYVTFELGARWGSGKYLAPVLAPGSSAAMLEGPLAGTNAVCMDNAADIQQFIEELAQTLGITPQPSSGYQNQLYKLSKMRAEEECAEQSKKFHETPAKNHHFWGRLKKGMTNDQVVELLGDPIDISRVDESTGLQWMWEYRDGYVMVDYYKMEVTDWRKTRPAGSEW